MPKKSPYRKKPRGISSVQLRNLEKSLYREWRSEHADIVPQNTAKHLSRAELLLNSSELLEEGSLAFRAANSYFEVRRTMTEEKVQELGAGSPAAATDSVVWSELLPGYREGAADITDITQVARGIAVAKNMLKTTMLDQNSYR